MALAGSAKEKKKDKRKREEEHAQLPLMKNLFAFRMAPQQPLARVSHFNAIMLDPGRGYCRHLMHLYPWELLALADHLQAEIEKPRITKWRPLPKMLDGKKRGIK